MPCRWNLPPPDFRPGSPLQYQYKLESRGAEWSAASSERSVHYASLSAGDYRFLVRAVGPDGAGPSAAVSFRVVAPVWRRAWFLVLAAVLGLAAAYSVHWYRVSHLIALERVRTRIVTDLHDDIGASLSQSEIVVGDRPQPRPPARSHLMQRMRWWTLAADHAE